MVTLKVSVNPIRSKTEQKVLVARQLSGRLLELSGNI